jgi:DNA-binding NtrC family response regulator
VVDDDIDLLKRMARYLEVKGYETHSASSAAEALVILEDISPEVIFLDLFLPDRSGLEVLELIGEKHPSSSVVMMSGGNTTQSAVSAIRKGADDCLDKPFPLEEMRRLIEEVTRARPTKVRAIREEGADGFLPAGTVGEPTIPSVTRVSTCDDAEKETIVKALEATRWNRTRAAEVLGISRRTVINKIHKWNLSPITPGMCTKES